jgi:hypothetical protein
VNVPRLLERSFAYSARFWIADQNRGFANAVRIRSGSRLRSIPAGICQVYYGLPFPWLELRFLSGTQLPLFVTTTATSANASEAPNQTPRTGGARGGAKNH